MPLEFFRIGPVVSVVRGRGGGLEIALSGARYRTRAPVGRGLVDITVGMASFVVC